MNKRELFIRSITGLLIVAVSLAAILWSPYSYLGFITLIAILGVREYFQMEEEKPGIILQNVVAFLFGGIIFFCGYLLITRHNPMVLFIVLPCLICGILVLQLMSYNVPQSLVNKGKAIYTAASYICLPLISGTIFLLAEYQPHYVLIPVFLIWANDVGAYMTGSLWGTKKIAPAISPGKSVQGTIGGFVITLVCALILWKIWPDLNSTYLIILGLATPCFALTGDLWESALKRKSGIKDSGNILPGHGGILDRYDSFLFVLPVAALAYYIFVL